MPSSQKDTEIKTKTAAVQVIPEATAVASGVGAAALALVNPVLGIVAAGLAPFITNRINQLYATRAARAVELLDTIDIAPERTLAAGAENAELKTDLISEYLKAAIETSSREKIQFLLHLIEYGLKSDLRMDVLFAKRIVRTIARIDEPEMILLASLSRMDRSSDGVRVVDIVNASGLPVNIVRSGIAVLGSEGLVLEFGARGEVFRVSDYGESILRELSRAVTPPDDEPGSSHRVPE